MEGTKLLRASCPSPFGPAELFKFAPDEFVRGNMANKVDSIKIAYRDVGGRATQERLAGSSQIFPDFVQVQTVFFIIHDFRV